MKRFMFMIISLIFLASCSASFEANEKREWCDPYGYCYEVQTNLRQANGEKDVNVFYTSSTETGLQYSVQPYHVTSVCSPEITGASVMKPLKNGFLC